MTERQIRATLAEVLAELDRTARRTVRLVVLPGLLGAGLAGCDHRAVSIQEGGVPGPDAGAGDALPGDVLPGDALPMDRALPPQRELMVVPPYMAPDPDLHPIPPPVGAYGVPPPFSDGGIGLMYGAPFPVKD